MRASIAIVLLVAVCILASGCASTSTPHSREGGGYYSRGSIHADSFPPGYSPGRVPGWGSYGRY
jgi:hypothetical protein